MYRIFRRSALPLVAIVAVGCSDSSQPISPDFVGMEALQVVVADGTTTTATLYAGQTIAVGTAEVVHMGDQVKVTYTADPGYCFTETHWEATYEISNITNRSGNPAPGRFAYGDDDLACLTTYMETASITGSNDGDYIVALHAVVVDDSPEGELPIVYGTFDEPGPGEGPEEGDIYGIDPHTGALTLVADIDQAGIDQFYPNGLAIDRDSRHLYFVTVGEDLFKVPANNPDPSNPTVTLVREGLAGGVIRSATIDGDFYYYVENESDNLFRVALDGLSPAEQCDLGEPAGLWFGDIAAEPGNGTIYGSARVGDGTGGDVVFFSVSVADFTAGGSCEADFHSVDYDFHLQVAFGEGGTLYGQQAISDPIGGEAGQWYRLSTTDGSILETLATAERSFTDIAGGLPPLEEFDETAWARCDGSSEHCESDRFVNRGNWATYLGPFETAETLQNTP